MRVAFEACAASQQRAARSASGIANSDRVDDQPGTARGACLRRLAAAIAACRIAADEMRPIVGRVQLAAESRIPAARDLPSAGTRSATLRQNAERRSAADLRDGQVIGTPRLETRRATDQRRGSRSSRSIASRDRQGRCETAARRCARRWWSTARRSACCDESERCARDCRNRATCRWSSRSNRRRRSGGAAVIGSDARRQDQPDAAAWPRELQRALDEQLIAVGMAAALVR